MGFEFGMLHEFQRRAGQTEADAFTQTFAQIESARAGVWMRSSTCRAPWGSAAGPKARLLRSFQEQTAEPRRQLG